MLWNIVLLVIIMLPITMIASYIHGGELLNAGQSRYTPHRPLPPDDQQFEYFGRLAWVALCAAVAGAWWWAV